MGLIPPKIIKFDLNMFFAEVIQRNRNCDICFSFGTVDNTKKSRVDYEQLSRAVFPRFRGQFFWDGKKKEKVEEVENPADAPAATAPGLYEALALAGAAAASAEFSTSSTFSFFSPSSPPASRKTN